MVPRSVTRLGLRMCADMDKSLTRCTPWENGIIWFDISHMFDVCFICLYIWVIFRANLDRYSIHRANMGMAMEKAHLAINVQSILDGS